MKYRLDPTFTLISSVLLHVESAVIERVLLSRAGISMVYCIFQWIDVVLGKCSGRTDTK